MTHTWSYVAPGCLYAALLLTVLYVVKFDGWRMPARPGLEDYAWVVFFELALGSLPIHGVATFAASGLVALAFFGLWLDVVLFRVFTIELGPSGVGTAVTTALYRELTEMRSARRFFREHLAFALLPLAAIALHFEPSFSPVPTTIVTVLLAAYGAWLFFSLSAARGAFLVLLAAWVATRVGGGLQTALAVGAAVSWVAISTRRTPASRLIRPFFRSGRVRGPEKFSPRSEDALLAELSPLLPPRSTSHGLLTGESVVMWTVESMARDYLAAFSPGSAQTPFIDRLLETGINCSQHFALCPLTNNAHVLLYASRYTAEDGFAPMDALRRAGYRTIYATPCDTRTYGLRKILQHAGFEHVLDSHALRNGSRASPSDADLTHSAWDRLRTLLADGRPFFLHVHTGNTHVPYRLSNPQNFCRFDSRTDLGRFLNGLEEADFHLSQFVSRLAELGRPSPPLLVVSADHGQSFGQFGYHSHGSAVVKEQVMVPCLFSHPKLQPRRIPYSTHLDVLPTVLDLLGLESTSPAFGTSMLAPGRLPAWLLWAGHPSRTRTSHFGLVKDERKYMFDWTVDRGYALGWNDEAPRELVGEEKIYYRSLISRVATKVGVE